MIAHLEEGKFPEAMEQAIEASNACKQKTQSKNKNLMAPTTKMTGMLRLQR